MNGDFITIALTCISKETHHKQGCKIKLSEDDHGRKDELILTSPHGASYDDFFVVGNRYAFKIKEVGE